MTEFTKLEETNKNMVFISVWNTIIGGPKELAAPTTNYLALTINEILYKIPL